MAVRFNEYTFTKTCKYANDETFDNYIKRHKITSRNANHHKIVRRLYMHGDVEKFKRYIRRFDFRPSKVFEVFCQHCDFNAVQWFLRAFNLNSEDVEHDCNYSIAPVLKSGFNEFKEWIIDFFNVGIDYLLYAVFTLTAMRGITFENLSWLFAKFNMNKEDILSSSGISILTDAEVEVIQKTIDWFNLDDNDTNTIIDNFPKYKDILHPYDLLVKHAAKLC